MGLPSWWLCLARRTDGSVWFRFTEPGGRRENREVIGRRTDRGGRGGRGSENKPDVVKCEERGGSHVRERLPPPPL